MTYAAEYLVSIHTPDYNAVYRMWYGRECDPDFVEAFVKLTPGETLLGTWRRLTGMSVPTGMERWTPPPPLKASSATQ